MKIWIKRTLFGLFGAAALLGSLAVYSHQRHGRHGGDPAQVKAMVVERVSRELALDEAQRSRLGTLADKLHEQRDALVGGGAGGPAGGGAMRAELQGLVAGPSFDRARALAMVQAKTQAVQVKGPEVVLALADFYDSLRPDQQARLREHLAKAHGHHGHRD
jgi:Spy/CpxP family protein refolding chaperone